MDEETQAPGAALTGKVAGHPGHVATHQPHSDGQAMVLEDVGHQVYVVGILAAFLCCCVEAAGC